MKRECSSNGRALASHARGKGIDAPLFQNLNFFVCLSCIPTRILVVKDVQLPYGFIIERMYFIGLKIKNTTKNGIQSTVIVYNLHLFSSPPFQRVVRGPYFTFHLWLFLLFILCFVATYSILKGFDNFFERWSKTIHTAT